MFSTDSSYVLLNKKDHSTSNRHEIGGPLSYKFLVEELLYDIISTRSYYSSCFLRNKGYRIVTRTGSDSMTLFIKTIPEELLLDYTLTIH